MYNVILLPIWELCNSFHEGFEIDSHHIYCGLNVSISSSKKENVSIFKWRELFPCSKHSVASNIDHLCYSPLVHEIKQKGLAFVPYTPCVF